MRLENGLERLIKSVKLFNEDFMESVGGTELVDFMVDFVIDPYLVIVSGILFNHLIHFVFA